MSEQQKPQSGRWQEELVDELYEGIRRKFARRRVIVNGVDGQSMAR